MTDVHMLDNGTVGNNIILKEPSVIGHEYSGYVTAVGSDVTNVKAGERVTVDNLVACGHCARCKRGHTNVCFNHGYIGFPPEGRGGLARFATVPATCVHRIPATLDFEEAAMMEPLSVCVSAINRADVKLGDDVIVFGAGPIGLMTSQVARAKGASSVCVADISKERLELARKLGATHTALFGADETDSRTNAQRIRDTLGDCPDIAIECSGVPHCLRTAIYAVRPGGVVAVVGIGPDDVSIPIVDVALREIDIRGCVCNNYCFPASIKLVASEKVMVKPIISHRFRLEEVHHALDLVRDRKVVKVMVDCSDN
ncbi:sorbitol dehydrogenase-like isoform X2 [Littorina saxatilis]